MLGWGSMEKDITSAFKRLETGQAGLLEGQKKLEGGQKKILAEIKSVHSDLIKHDERADTFMQKLLDVEELQRVVGKLRAVVREELNVEV